MSRTAIKRAGFGLALLGLVIFFRCFYFQKQASAVGDVSNFKDTEIVVHPDVPLSPNKNVIWCGTLALAWNEAISHLGGELNFVKPEREAELLNRQEFTKADLDEQSYVVVADSENNHVGETIRQKIKDKFGDAVSPRLLPDDSGRDSNKVDFYACLYKELEFPRPFHKNAPLWFDLRRVADFGFGLEPMSYFQFSNTHETIGRQVGVLSYISDDNFVLRLKIKKDGDQLILAKIPPGKTLQATMDSVLPALNSKWNWGVGDQDELAIPKIDFDLMADFKELEGPLTSGVQIETVAENLIFRLNETGVKLTAFARVSLITGMSDSEHKPPPPRHFIFNKPFLVLLKRESSPRPYFALWVGNPTLLVRP